VIFHRSAGKSVDRSTGGATQVFVIGTALSRGCYACELSEASVLQLFTEIGAYLRGHFRLTSGLHSAEYLQCAKVLAIPKYAEQLGRELASKLRTTIGDAHIDVVVSPAMGGIIIGHEVARAFDVPALFTERDSSSNHMMLRRGFELRPDERVIIIEDVITTGGSTREVVRVAQAAGAHVLAAGSIIDRSGGEADVGVPRVALETLKPVTYDPADCPFCREGQPVIKPGSRRT
jgi:orotate phosphoribosyltransferase